MQLLPGTSGPAASAKQLLIGCQPTEKVVCIGGQGAMPVQMHVDCHGSQSETQATGGISDTQLRWQLPM